MGITVKKEEVDSNEELPTEMRHDLSSTQGSDDNVEELGSSKISGKTIKIKGEKKKTGSKKRAEKLVPDDSWSADHTVPSGWLQKKVQ